MSRSSVSRALIRELKTNVVRICGKAPELNSSLLEAARCGDESKLVAALARRGVDVNCRERDNCCTPLLVACNCTKLSVFRLLLGDPRVDVNARDTQGRTVLHLWKDQKLVEEILHSKRTDIDWNAADKIGQTPLLWFARMGDEESVRRLIGVELVNLLATTIDVFTALHQVAERKTFPRGIRSGDISNRYNIVDLVLEEVGRRGHNVVSFVDATDILNRSALHYIAEDGCIEILELLYKFSPNMNVNSVDLHGFTPLHLAVRNRHDAVVERLLRLQSIDANVRVTVTASNPDNLKPFEGPDYEICRPNLFLKTPEEQPSRDLTALHFAVMDGRIEAVRLLLEWEGINLDAVDSAGLTPLHYSVQNGHWEVVELLLNKGKASATLNINAVDSAGRTPLHFAVMQGRMEVVRPLLEWEGINLDAVDSAGRTPLHLAVMYRRMEVVRLLLKWEGINIDAVDSAGLTPLHFAVMDGSVQVVRLLLKSEGINLDAVDNQGRTLLHIAVMYRRMAVVRLLLEWEGIKIDAVDSAGLTPLQYSVQNWQWQVVELLLKKGKPCATLNIDAVDSEGRTPLHIAVMYRRMEVVRLLLEWEGIKIDAVDSAGLTPLHYSVQKGDWDVVELLLKKGKASATLNINAVDSVDSAGRTPLHFAVMEGRMEVVRLLLEWEGINLDAVDSEGRTPLYYSVQNGYTEVMKLLLKKGKPFATLDYATLDYNREKGFFEELLRLATKRGHVETVKELLEHPKLDVNAQDNMKMTPLLYAIKAGDVDMVKVLCQNDKFHRLRATEENSAGHTPLQIVVDENNRSEYPKLKAIEKVLLERPEVKDFVDRLYRDRQAFVDAANALLVGAALIASVTFAGWLQPPLGYTPYYDFSQPFPAPPGAYESYAAIEQNPKVKAFWVFNSLSFFFAIATVLAGADAAMPSLDDAFIGRVVKSVRKSLIISSVLLVTSVVCVLGAFASGGFAVLPPLLKYDTSMIITVCVGGTVCMIILAKFLWKLFKAIHIRFVKRETKPATLVEGAHCSPTCIRNGS